MIIVTGGLFESIPHCSAHLMSIQFYLFVLTHVQSEAVRVVKPVQPCSNKPFNAR